MDFKDIAKQEELWKDIVLKGEMLTIKLLTEEAKKELEEEKVIFTWTKSLIAEGIDSDTAKDIAQSFVDDIKENDEVTFDLKDGRKVWTVSIYYI